MKANPVQISVIPPGGVGTVFVCKCGTVATCIDGRVETACGRCHRPMKFLAAINAIRPLPFRARHLSLVEVDG